MPRNDVVTVAEMAHRFFRENFPEGVPTGTLSCSTNSAHFQVSHSDLQEQTWRLEEDNEKRAKFRQQLKRVFEPEAEGKAPYVRLIGKVQIGWISGGGDIHMDLTIYGAFDCEVEEQVEVALSDSELEAQEREAQQLADRLKALVSKKTKTVSHYKCVARGI